MQNVTDQLESAGLESQDCPMLDCYGHLNYVKGEDFFICVFCKAIFPTKEALTNWAKDNWTIKLLTDYWAQVDREDSESDQYGFVAEGL